MSTGLTPQNADISYVNARVNDVIVAQRMVAGTLTSNSLLANTLEAVQLLADQADIVQATISNATIADAAIANETVSNSTVESETVTDSTITNATITNLTCTNPIFPSLQYVVNVKYYGAKGDGVTNDATAIQTAINYARTNNLTLYFPPGRYIVQSPLNFSQWNGFSIVGGGAGWVTQANSPCVIIGKGITTSTIFDFSGSSFGTVQGISFTNDATSLGTFNCIVLFAVITGATNNNCIFNTMINCNVYTQGVPPNVRANVLCHNTQNMRFENCKFTNSGNRILIITDNATLYGVSSSFGYTLGPAANLNFHSIISCDFTGNNAVYVLADATGQNGFSFYVKDCFALITGNNTYFVNFIGPWNDVSLENCRIDGASLGSNRGPIFLTSGSSTSLSNFKISAYASDGGSLISGTGDLNSGQIISSAQITGPLTGNITGVSFTTSGNFNLTLTGNVTLCKVLAAGLGTISVSGTLELDDGNGGYIVFSQALGSGSASYNFPASGNALSGTYCAQYAGNVAEVFTSIIGGTRYSVVTTAATANPTSTLAVIGSGTTQSGFTATFVATGGTFVVRRRNAPTLT